MLCYGRGTTVLRVLARPELFSLVNIKVYRVTSLVRNSPPLGPYRDASLVRKRLPPWDPPRILGIGLR